MDRKQPPNDSSIFSLSTILFINVYSKTLFDVPSFKIFGTKGKTECMLNHWDNKGNHYLVDLVKILREMERDDVASLLQKEIDKKGVQCNCTECGHIV